MWKKYGFAVWIDSFSKIFFFYEFARISREKVFAPIFVQPDIIICDVETESYQSHVKLVAAVRYACRIQVNAWNTCVVAVRIAQKILRMWNEKRETKN